MDLKRADLLIAAVALGDAIGSTSDGLTEAVALTMVQRHRDRGWPSRAIGSDERGRAQTGSVTAQARALHKAWLLAGGRFDGAVFARELQAFARGNRRPLEPALHKSIADLDAGLPWWHAGERAWRERGPAAVGSCDAVARAIPIAALARTDAEAMAAARLSALVTDWSPGTVEATAALVLGLREVLAGRRFPARWIERGLAAPCDLHAELDAWHDAAVGDGVVLAAEYGTAPFAIVSRARTLADVVAPRPLTTVAWPDALPLALQPHADLLRDCAGPRAFGLAAVLGGSACAATACAAAMVAAILGHLPEA